MTYSFELFERSKKIGIVSHDSGGAQVLSHFVLNNPKQYLFSITGPATKIYHENLGNEFKKSVSLDEILAICDLLIFSTGWSKHEVAAIAKAKRQGVFSIAILDHWVNYKMRFMLDNNFVFPNAIWVSDESALKIAKREFPEVEVKQVSNYYLESEIRKVNSLHNTISNPTGERALFLGENISEMALKNFGDQLHFGYNEKTSFTFLLEFFKSQINLDRILRIRPHPSESDVSKYIEIVKGSGAQFSQIEISTNSLNEDLSWSTSVYGMTSYALYLADRADKPTFCCIPNSKFDLPFPSNSIKYLYH